MINVWTGDLFSWQLDRNAITATSGYGVLPGAPLTAISMAKVPSSHSPQGCPAWAWPAHLIDSLSASKTGPSLNPALRPLWARRPEEEEQFRVDLYPITIC